jgi:hypothetical protein
MTWGTFPIAFIIKVLVPFCQPFPNPYQQGKGERERERKKEGEKR